MTRRQGRGDPPGRRPDRHPPRAAPGRGPPRAGAGDPPRSRPAVRRADPAGALSRRWRSRGEVLSGTPTPDRAVARHRRPSDPAGRPRARRAGRRPGPRRRGRLRRGRAGRHVAILAHRLLGLDLARTWSDAAETIVIELRLPRDAHGDARRLRPRPSPGRPSRGCCAIRWPTRTCSGRRRARRSARPSP